MFEPTCRRAMLFTMLLLALIAPQPAAAQDPFGLPGDLLLLKVREVQVERDRARLQDDIDRGDSAGMNRDLQSIQRHERGVQRVERWVRRDIFLPLGFYQLPPRNPPVPPSPALIPHPQYPGYGYFPSDPDHLYRLPQPSSDASASASADPSTPTPRSTAIAPAATAPAPLQRPIIIEIVNAGPPETNVYYAVDGVLYQIEGGQRQKIQVSPSSTVAYDPGGGLGTRRYSLSAGVYEFRPGDSGLALFKLITGTVH
jgi:hypothetical protein